MSDAIKSSVAQRRFRYQQANSHAAQFYHDDWFLCESVATFVEGALSHNEAAIVVATKSHCDEIKRLLRTRCEDFDHAHKFGQLTILEAETILPQIQPKGRVEEQLFEKIILSLVDSVLTAFPRVRIYGELVNLLWEQGYADETVALERFWNRAAATRNFDLLCGYSLDGFAERKTCEHFQSVCSTHSHVFPAEDYHAHTDDAEKLRVVTSLQQKTLVLDRENPRKVDPPEPIRIAECESVNEVARVQKTVDCSFVMLNLDQLSDADTATVAARFGPLTRPVVLYSGVHTKPEAIAALKSSVYTFDRGGSQEAVVIIAGLEIDPIRHRVLREGDEIEFTISEFKILYYLATRPGQVASRSQIIAAIKMQNFAVSERLIDVQVFKIRKKLGEYGQLIETVRGIGYRFKD